MSIDAQVGLFVEKNIHQEWRVSTPEEGMIASFKYEDDAHAFAKDRGEFVGKGEPK